MIAWFARNHVAANLLMAFAVVMGLLAMTQIPIRQYPDVEIPVITVNVPYLGAAPQEVESAVCTRIEEAVSGIEGVETMTSVSHEGYCAASLELLTDADEAQALGQVENRVYAIDTFPPATERPIIGLAKPPQIAIEVAVVGVAEERTLKELARQVRDDLRALPEITEVSLVRSRRYEISVEISKASLLRNNLTFDDVAAAVRHRSLDVPGGGIKTEDGEVVLRTRGQAYRGPDLENLVVSVRQDGTRALLKDVAQVVDGFEDTAQSLQFDGRPAALVQVRRVGDQDHRQITEAVRRYVSAAASRLPAGIDLVLWNDQSVILEGRIGALLDSGALGLLLVLILLTVFLRPHLGLWVAAGIPIAFLGALALMHGFGQSINSVSIVGFIVALGIVVDDAVVVGESAHSAQSRGIGRLAGAIEGAQGAMLPVTFGVLTSMAAFAPLLFATGTAGQLMFAVTVTVLCCLAFSLLESQFVLPAHLGHRQERMPLGEFGLTLLATVVVAAFVLAPDLRSGLALAVVAVAGVVMAHLAGTLGRLGLRFTALQTRWDAAFDGFVQRRFRRLAATAISRRSTTLAIAAVLLGWAVLALVSGHMPSVAEPRQGEQAIAQVTMPLGVNAAATDRVLGKLAAAALRLQEKHGDQHGEGPIEHIVEALGGRLTTANPFAFGPAAAGSHLGEVVLQLTSSETRPLSTDEVVDAWRTEAGAFADSATVRFFAQRDSLGPGIEIQVAGDDLGELRRVTSAIRARLAEYPGVYDVADSLMVGKDERQLSVTPAGEALGITLAELGRQVRQAFYGEEAQRIQRGKDDVRVMVRYTAEERRSLDALHEMRVRGPDGRMVPFEAVAEVRAARGQPSIARTDGQRSATVTAEVDPAIASPGAVLDALRANFLDDFMANHPQLRYRLESEGQDGTDLASLVPLLLVALFAIYALLAIPLRSYTAPLLIMSVLPFALVGAVFGHFLMLGMGRVEGFSVASAFGVVAANGVVVNATLMLLLSVNRLRSRGDSLTDALVGAAASRFRPILITTATTFVGLVPLMLSRSVSAMTMIPLTISLAWGVVFAAVAALLFVPALYLALDDIRARARSLADYTGRVIGTASRLARWMVRYPEIQNALHDRDFKYLLVPEDLGLDVEEHREARRGLVRVHYQLELDVAEMNRQLDVVVARAASAGDQSSEVRRWAEQQAFRLGVHTLDGAITPTEAALPLSSILDCCLRRCLAAARAECRAENGDMPGSRVALIALGALGRRECVIGGPLQIALVYSRAAAAPAIVPAFAEWHADLLRRLMKWLRELSGEGTVFELREPFVLPGTDRRQPACAMRDLAKHLERASIADLRALLHARVVEDDAGLGAEFAALRHRAIGRPHDHRELAADIRRARQRVAERHVDRHIWDVERCPGGLDEVRLAAEYVQLASGERLRDDGVDTLSSIYAAAGARGQLDAPMADELAAAAALWLNLTGFLSMAFVDTVDLQSLRPHQQAAIAEFCGVPALSAVQAKVAETARGVAQRIDALLDGR